ncbi:MULTISPECIES: TSUP family transporter [unclassified Moraxella]|uniref:TSUP family transporter n=1 Tax=unclassified Moraxella TaxID=2685852 RepID=UPI003AF73588
MIELTWQTLLLLFFVAGVAGFVDAIAGGGGLLTIPAMLMANIPPLFTLGTNKLQATAGSFSASLTMIKKGLIHPKQIWQAVVACFVGAMLGAIAVQLSPPDLLTKAIPFLIAMIGIYYLFAPKAGEVSREPRLSESKWRYGVVPAIGFYDGYLGPGTGMFFGLGGVALKGYDLITATANAKVLNFTSNIASLVFFILGGKVLWSVGIAMMVGQAIGASLGANVAVKGGVKFIRPLIVVMCFAMLIKYVFFS